MADEANSDASLSLSHEEDSLLSSEIVSLSPPRVRPLHQEHQQDVTKNLKSSSETHLVSDPKSPIADSNSSALPSSKSLADKGSFSKSGLGGTQELANSFLSRHGKDFLRGSVQPGRPCFVAKRKQLTSDRVNCPMEIRVIDDTALIGSVFVFLNAKNASKNWKEKLDEKKIGKGLRRREMKDSEKARSGSKMVYSRKELESLRFSDLDEQRRMWKDVHTGLGPIVRKEYDFLLTLRPTKNVHLHFGPIGLRSANVNSEPTRRFAKKSNTPVFGAFGGRGRVNEVNVSAN